MTVCLLNWKRPENVVRIIRDLRNQDAKPNIFLWDNSPYDHSNTFDADWTVKSSENKRCWPRWFMAAMAQTDYIMSLDDDLTLKDKSFISDMISILDSAGKKVVGIEGVILHPGKLYHECDLIGIPPGTVEVDIIKGKLLSFHISLFKYLDLGAIHHTDPSGTLTTEDDIAISGILGKKLGKHWIMPELYLRIQKLPDHHALWRQEGHFQKRDEAVNEFFPWHKETMNDER